MKYQFLIAATGSFLLMGSSAQAASFMGLGDFYGPSSAKPLGFPAYSSASGVSADGSVVVGEALLDFIGSSYGAFRWENGVMTLVADPGPSRSFATGKAASADGSVVVGDILSRGSGFRGFRWEDGDITIFPPQYDFFVPFDDTNANGVSADGSVVVGARAGLGGNQAFRWENGTFIDLGTRLPGDRNSTANGVSADGSVVVGQSGKEPFRWENGVMTGLGSLSSSPFLDPTFISSSANAVSADGSVVVGISEQQAFRWENGVMKGLGFLPDDAYSEAVALSANGSVVVGQSRLSSGGFSFEGKPFLWESTGGIQPLQGFLTSAGLDLTGWRLFEVGGISADGLTIVGTGTNPGGQSEAWLARLDAPPIDGGSAESVPEPSLALGLIGVGAALLAKKRPPLALPSVKTTA